MKGKYRYTDRTKFGRYFWVFFFCFNVFICLFFIPFVVFGWVGNAPKNTPLINSLKQHGYVRSAVVENAMKLLDRGNFVLPGDEAPYADTPRHIGHGATISAPHMHAICAELLQTHMDPCSTVLDVGSGSGYFTTLLAVMMSLKRNVTTAYCGSRITGKVIGLEHIPELVEQAKANMERQGFTASYLHSSSVDYIITDGRYGFPTGAPYDLIHVGAASNGLPGVLLEQLKVGGRMVVPVRKFGKSKGQQLVVIDKTGPVDWKIEEIMPVDYVPLTVVTGQIERPDPAYMKHVDFDY